MHKQHTIWQSIQILCWAGGVALLGALLFAPTVGLHLFWHILIPVAPALLVFAPGLWRNICPLAYTSLLPWQLGLSSRRRLSQTAQGLMYLIAVALLLLIVPLRHVVFNTSGLGTALALMGVGVLAILSGAMFERKSGWCASLCPVYPVESLYGSRPLVTLPNVHCVKCYNCVQPCSEKRAGTDSTLAGLSKYHNLAGTIMTGGFAGFVWSWFQVEDFHGQSRSQLAIESYGTCFLGLLVTLVLYQICRLIINARHVPLLNRVFACAAISTYYWYALPTMLGFGPVPSAAIIDVSSFLPDAAAWVLRVLPIVVFGWWLVIRTASSRTWMVAPPE